MSVPLSFDRRLYVEDLSEEELRAIYYYYLKAQERFWPAYQSYHIARKLQDKFNEHWLPRDVDNAIEYLETSAHVAAIVIRAERRYQRH